MIQDTNLDGDWWPQDKAPDDAEHEHVRITLLGNNVWVDKGLVSLLRGLNNDLGWRTQFSCQGGRKTRPQNTNTNSWVTWAYISFYSYKTAWQFFVLLKDHLRYLHWDGPKKRGGGCVRFPPSEIATAAKLVRKLAKVKYG